MAVITRKHMPAIAKKLCAPAFWQTEVDTGVHELVTPKLNVKRNEKE